MTIYQKHTASLQLRRAISILAEGKDYLRSMLSRRQNNPTGAYAAHQFQATLLSAPLPVLDGLNEGSGHLGPAVVAAELV
jgi:hypothetical protein